MSTPTPSYTTPPMPTARRRTPVSVDTFAKIERTREAAAAVRKHDEIAQMKSRGKGLSDFERMMQARPHNAGSDVVPQRVGRTHVDMLDFVESNDACGAPILASNAPDLCQNEGSR